eukprot:TRINITY_DN30433_c0_g1_i2.p1 TRINITY_DN30433_c0_g1~~TRINITY_DN30433_c0_g1_i2.p1  ORF type:complete len:220 (-),score=42.15 TRINITY_DN30433_c0_g1_i2:56-715(-)
MSSPTQIWILFVSAWLLTTPALSWVGIEFASNPTSSSSIAVSSSCTVTLNFTLTLVDVVTVVYVVDSVSDGSYQRTGNGNSGYVNSGTYQQTLEITCPNIGDNLTYYIRANSDNDTSSTSNYLNSSTLVLVYSGSKQADLPQAKKTGLTFSTNSVVVMIVGAAVATAVVVAGVVYMRNQKLHSTSRGAADVYMSQDTVKKHNMSATSFKSSSFEVSLSK